MRTRNKDGFMNVAVRASLIKRIKCLAKSADTYLFEIVEQAISDLEKKIPTRHNDGSVTFEFKKEGK